jgi:DNA-directed RNA polymerase specialized sigma24 family protein
MSTGAAFESTNWSMVLLAHDDPRLLDKLLRRYVAPIYAYVRRAGRTRDDAAHLTQEFVATVVLERGLIDKADPARGRFRTFLKSALSHFLVDQHRRATARVRAAERPALTGLRLEDLEPGEGDDPGAAFDRQWAGTVLAAALEAVEADCLACGQEVHWAAFSAAIIEPALRQAAAPGLEELAGRLGLSQATQVSSMIQTVRRKFKRTLRKVIQDTVADPAQTDDELRDLKAFLGL